MKEETNIRVLNDLNKSVCMGSDGVKAIYDKAEGKKLRLLIENLLEEYEDLKERISKTYDKYSDKELDETNKFNKIMTWYGISIRTINDSTNSKISEMLIQGLNMGIIEGKKLVNNNEFDKCIYKLVEDFIDMQERYVEDFKEYL